LHLTVHSIANSNTISDSPNNPPAKIDQSQTTVDKNCPFECRVCNETFVTESQLTDHLYGHIESSGRLESVKAEGIIAAVAAMKPLECSRCQLRFDSAKELTEHLIVDGDRRPHACDCGRRFGTSDKLAKHVALSCRRSLTGRFRLVYQLDSCNAL